MRDIYSICEPLALRKNQKHRRTNLLNAAEFLKVSPIWLASGKDSLRKDAGSNHAIESKESNVITIDSRKKTYESKFIPIPHLNVVSSMGSGKIASDYIEVIRDITVSLDWMKTQGMSYSKLENLAIIDGDSMEGPFRNGDSLLVDRGITEIRTDAVCVFSLNGDLFIKRLQRMTGGRCE